MRNFGKVRNNAKVWKVRNIRILKNFRLDKGRVKKKIKSNMENSI